VPVAPRWLGRPGRRVRPAARRWRCRQRQGWVHLGSHVLAAGRVAGSARSGSGALGGEAGHRRRSGRGATRPKMRWRGRLATPSRAPTPPRGRRPPAATGRRPRGRGEPPAATGAVRPTPAVPGDPETPSSHSFRCPQGPIPRTPPGLAAVALGPVRFPARRYDAGLRSVAGQPVGHGRRTSRATSSPRSSLRP
jgi:hypothetical protein